jgi:hypothetical protein
MKLENKHAKLDWKVWKKNTPIEALLPFYESLQNTGKVYTYIDMYMYIYICIATYNIENLGG